MPRALPSLPAITVMFWAIKIITTGLGEATADYLAALDIELLGAVGLALLVGALALQYRARLFSPARYWFAVAAVAVFGTVAADAPRVIFGIPYLVLCSVYAAGVAVALVVWHRAEGTIDIHLITTPRRFVFYWVAVVLTFALGTSAGDLVAVTAGLGFGQAAVVFGLAILVPAALYRWARLGPVAAFWIAYVLTRPLGASLADGLGKPHPLGLGLGDGAVALGGALVAAALVGVQQRSRLRVAA